MSHNDNTKSRKILVVDDSKTNLILLKTYLDHMGLTVLLCEDGKTAIKTAVSQLPDAILLDVMMPDIDGYEVCKKLKGDSRTSSIPIIFISAKSQTSDKIKGLELGATDYITKPFNVGELKARIGAALQIVELQEKLLSLANTDGLTGLANHRYFFDILEREVQQAKIKDKPLAVMMFDIDHFKSVNDTYGHRQGDTVLKEIGQIFQENIYPLDVAARYGGEEFIILMPETSSEKAYAASERLRQIIDRHQWKILGELISVSISVGIVCTDRCNLTSTHELVEKADMALYAAKRRGRNCVVSWNEADPDKKMQKSENQDYYEMQKKVSSLAEQLRSQALGTISALTQTMGMVIKDNYIIQHSKNVQIYSGCIAEEMQLSSELQERIGTAALLQDIGKISIPENILKKVTPLTDDEQEIIKQHPIFAMKILEPIGIFNLELQIIKHHHENFDGTGYPGHLKGKEIPLGSRILRVADTFDAITISECEYRQARSFEDALEEIHKFSGTQFDPDVIEAFRNVCEKHKSDWPLSKKECLLESR